MSAGWRPVPFLERLPRLAHIPCMSLNLGPFASSPSLLTCFFFLSDVLRRRFQINTMSGMGYQYKSVADAVRVIVGQEGIRGLYKGIVPNLLKVAPSMASSWLSFEMTRDFLVSLKPETDSISRPL